MDPRSNERISIASSNDSLILYLNVVNSRSKYRDAKEKARQRRKASRRRSCPVLALLAVMLYSIASGSGIAISAITVKLGLQTTAAGNEDMIARVLLFTTSCMGAVYVLLHLISARQLYVKSHGSPQIYGYFTVGLTLLIARLSVLVWIATLVANALVATRVGFDPRRGIRGNIVWFELGIAVFGFISLGLLIVALEISERPFATLGISNMSFIRGRDAQEGPERSETFDTFERSISQQGLEKDRKGSSESRKGGKQTPLTTTAVHGAATKPSFDRSRINTPESPTPVENESDPNHSAERFALWANSPDRRPEVRRARSQLVPTPLEAIFGPTNLPIPGAGGTDSPGFNGDFSWRPPTREFTKHQRRQIAELYHNTLRPGPPGTREDDDVISLFSYTTTVVNMPAVPPPSLAPSRPGMHLNNEPTLPVTIPETATTNTRPKATGPTRPGRLALADLPARAAARTRNSLLVREADLNPNPRLSDVSKRWTAIGMVTPPASASRAGFSLDSLVGDLVEVPMPETAPRDLPREDDGTIVEDAHPLARNNSTRSHLVRNFSRPGRLLRMPAGSAGSAGGRDDEEDHDLLARERELIAAVRRSVSLPEGVVIDTETTPQQNMRRSQSVLPEMTQRGANPVVKNTLLEVGSQFGAAVAGESIIHRPRPTRSKTTAGASPSSRDDDSGRRIKGLGQGSARRLEREVRKWRKGVKPPDGEKVRLNVFPRVPVRAGSGQNSTGASEGKGPMAGVVRRGSGKLSRENSASSKRARLSQNF